MSKYFASVFCPHKTWPEISDRTKARRNQSVDSHKRDRLIIQSVSHLSNRLTWMHLDLNLQSGLTKMSYGSMSGW